MSNAAVAVDPELTYVRVKTGPLEAPMVLAEALVEKVLGADADVKVLERFPGAALDGVRYEPPFPYIPAKEYGERGHTVLLADFVTAEDGTGLVHTAIAFGEDDFQLGQRYGLNVVNPVRLDGTYDERIGKYAGRFVKDADPDLVEDLRSRGKLLKAEEYEHSYPFCWRSGDPLLYYAKPAWYIKTSQVRDRLLAANDSINWHPEHIKAGRMGNWLENNVDWALSRERYWGTPLPVWRCEEGHIHCIGSLDELEELSGVRLEDPHRPYVDDVGFPCPQCSRRMERVPEVIDVWFDSGCMPFAQYHAPFENEEKFQGRFPADFICEALDQTRGWFYSLLGVSTLLFDRASYENVVCLGLILDENARKMSKSLGNIVDPWSVLDEYGADALRWYFFTSKQPWDGYQFSPERVGEGVRLFLKQLWSTYRLYVLYANANAVEARRRRASRRCSTTGSCRGSARRPRSVTERLDAYDATIAGRAIADVRRRPLELVRAALAAALLGGRRDGVRDAARVPRHGRAAARAVRAVRRRRDPRQPRRVGRQRPPDRLARAARALAAARGGHGGRARDGAARAVGAGRGEGQGPPAAARGGHRRGGSGARGDRAAGRRRARGAERQGAALRRQRRRARRLRDQAELPHARAALRQADAARRRGGRGARPGRGRRGAALRRRRSAS